MRGRWLWLGAPFSAGWTAIAQKRAFYSGSCDGARDARWLARRTLFVAEVRCLVAWAGTPQSFDRTSGLQFGVHTPDFFRDLGQGRVARDGKGGRCRQQ